MDKQHYKRVTFDIPVEDYVYLKMICARQEVSMKAFLRNAFINSIEEALDIIALEKVTDDDRKNAIPWEEVKKELGWKI